MRTFLVSVTAVTLALLVSAAGFAASAADPSSPEELRKILDAAPPDPKEHSKNALAKIYMDRSKAAAALGDVDRVKRIEQRHSGRRPERSGFVRTLL